MPAALVTHLTHTTTYSLRVLHTWRLYVSHACSIGEQNPAADDPIWQSLLSVCQSIGQAGKALGQLIESDVLLVPVQRPSGSGGRTMRRNTRKMRFASESLQRHFHGDSVFVPAATIGIPAMLCCFVSTNGAAKHKFHKLCPCRTMRMTTNDGSSLDGLRAVQPAAGQLNGCQQLAGAAEGQQQRRLSASR